MRLIYEETELEQFNRYGKVPKNKERVIIERDHDISSLDDFLELFDRFIKAAGYNIDIEESLCYCDTYHHEKKVQFAVTRLEDLGYKWNEESDMWEK